MARCNCNGQTCGCVIVAGDGIEVTGAGTATQPLVISAEGGGGGGGWDSGDLKQVAHGSTPAGWLECLGQAVSRAAYSDLFAAVGVTYGVGDGATTFNVPNYAGRSLFGAGSGYALGVGGGVATTTLAIPNLPPHTHVVAAHVHGMANHTHSDAHDHGATTTESALHTHPLAYRVQTNNNTATTGSGGANRVTDVTIGTGGSTASTGGQPERHTHGVPAWGGRTDGPSPANSDAAAAANTSSVGSATPFTNLPPYRVVRVLIKT